MRTGQDRRQASSRGCGCDRRDRKGLEGLGSGAGLAFGGTLDAEQAEQRLWGADVGTQVRMAGERVAQTGASTGRLERIPCVF